MNILVPPTPRQEVFDTYWKFAAERQAMFMRRVRCEVAPWTEDPILRDHKFCCTFRAADRVSQDLIRMLYADPSASKADLVFRATAYRTFSKPQTWVGLVNILGRHPTIGDLQDGSFEKALDHLHGIGEGLYTAAFIVAPPTSYGKPLKHNGHAALFNDMFVKGAAGDRIASAGSLKEVYDILHGFPYMGDFMSYQTAVDINYSTATDFSENDFTKPGPGAVRGLAKVFTSLGTATSEQAIMWMVERQQQEFERLGLKFDGLWGRPLHAIDAQGLFCETDKYSRVAFPHLASNRSRIKAKFKPTREPVTYFFPPKWGVNEQMLKPIAKPWIYRLHGVEQARFDVWGQAESARWANGQKGEITYLFGNGNEAKPGDVPLEYKLVDA